MGDLVLTLLIFIGVIAFTALLFGGWVVVGLVRLVLGTVQQKSKAGLSVSDPLACPNQRCRSYNQLGAKFCRRCGQPLTVQNSGTGVRRAAMW